MNEKVESGLEVEIDEAEPAPAQDDDVWTEEELAAARQDAETICAAIKWDDEPAPAQSETNDQIAAVMLLHGTPEQQAEAARYAGLPPPAQDEREAIQIPVGAIENGRAFADRLEMYGFECEAGGLPMCSEWQEFRRCFEHLAEWAWFSRPAQTERDSFKRYRLAGEFCVSRGIDDDSEIRPKILDAFCSGYACADRPAQVEQRSSCKWTRDDDTGAYETTCGVTWHLSDGGEPEEHGQYYCHHCGNQIDDEGASDE